jgi:hypothetical protein
VRRSACIIAVTVTIAVATGFLVGLVAVLASELPVSTVTIPSALEVAAFAPLPISLPAGLVGGGVAALLVHRERFRRSTGNWARRGCAWGAGMGLLASLSWYGYVVFNVRTPEFPLLVFFAALGLVAGAIAGCVVGAFVGRLRCGISRESRALGA